MAINGDPSDAEIRRVANAAARENIRLAKFGRAVSDRRPHIDVEIAKPKHRKGRSMLYVLGDLGMPNPEATRRSMVSTSQRHGGGRADRAAIRRFSWEDGG